MNTRATDRIIGATLSLLFVIVLFLFGLLPLNESSFKWCETIGTGFFEFRRLYYEQFVVSVRAAQTHILAELRSLHTEKANGKFIGMW